MHKGRLQRAHLAFRFLAVVGVVGSFSFFADGCTPLRSFFQLNQSGNEQTKPSPTQPKPQVTNSFAYARYVALHLKAPHAPEEVKEALFSHAVSSAISASELLRFISSVSDKPQVGTPEKSTSVLRFEEFESQLEQCVSGTRSRAECCRALAWPAAVLPRWSGIAPDQQVQVLDSAASNPDKATELLSWAKLSTRVAGSEASQSFSGYQLAGMKAWLSSCHGELSGAPSSLSKFLETMAADLRDPQRWQISFHAKSRAKRLPRRIYARTDGELSFAETLNTDCSVQETEVIRRRSDGALDFWVYDATGRLSPKSHFPAPRSDNTFETVEKLAPDSCMGCHYDFETRKFDRMKVSAEELRLPKTSELPVRCLAAGETPAEDN